MQVEISHFRCKKERNKNKIHLLKGKKKKYLNSLYHPVFLFTKRERKDANLCISTCSISPEKEKNSFISCSVAPKETLLTFTVFV